MISHGEKTDIYKPRKETQNTSISLRLGEEQPSTIQIRFIPSVVFCYRCSYNLTLDDRVHDMGPHGQNLSKCLVQNILIKWYLPLLLLKHRSFYD